MEIHDLVSLQLLQKIQISSPSPHTLSLCSCYVEAVPTPFSNAVIARPSPSSHSAAGAHVPSTTQCVFVCNGEQLSVLKMISISSQVTSLVFDGRGAVRGHPALHRLHQSRVELYEQCGNSLLAKGDFEKAVTNFVQAGTDFVTVIRQFPDLVLHPMLNISAQQGNKATSQVVHRSPLRWCNSAIFTD